MPSEARLRMGGTEWAMLAGLALLWAGSYFSFEVLVASLPPSTIVLARVLIGAAALWLALRLRGGAMPRGCALWASFAAAGVLDDVVPCSLLVTGEMQITSGLASILTATTPMFTVLAAQASTRDERLDVGEALGLAGLAALDGGPPFWMRRQFARGADRL